MTYLAHSENAYEHTQSLSDHLTSVADLAAQFAAAWGGGDLAHLAGLLHDLGKYGDLFQARLEGREKHIDHWSAGATALSEHFGEAGLAAAVAVQGHHLGLQQAEEASLKPDRLHQPHPPEFRLSAPSLEELLGRFAADDLALPEQPPESTYSGLDGAAAAAMLDLRMLYSCLVDADGLDTEAHCNGTADGAKQYREAGPTLDAERDLKVLLSHIERLASKSQATEKVNELRADLLEACLKAAKGPQGCFTLSAPTGSGKTLSMLAFALRHALTHGLRRIVMVIPYLSIIDQTVAEYRKVLSQVLAPQELDRYLLEDHSLAGTRDGRSDGRPSDEQDNSARLLAQNWDAPIVITTSVQFLESLFANRSRACRKLHRLAGSVILFDEVQTLGSSLAVPTLATLSHLTERYSASVVFSTATQPAFTHLNEAVEWFADSGWQPREIVPAELDLFGRARRTHIEWPQRSDQRPSWETLAGELAQVPQVLCIVNLKRHAQALLEALSSQLESPDLCHLSTS
ncbi:CRISPR-associated endonuclease Cas3'', partial [bacterium]|nr:CRISPR-associated endonuclease Cas3'' [bacterium]